MKIFDDNSSSKETSKDEEEKIIKDKNRWVSNVIQKKAGNEDLSSKMEEIEKEEDEEFELNDYVEHDKKYFFVHSTKISCKLCSFKGKLIVQHYKMKHPESEVLISRINPDITKVLIENAIQNLEEYDKNHPKLETKCNFKCPFCLMIIRNTPNGFYNHISSHTGEYRFRCDHCLYWACNSAKIRVHLNQMHFKIHKNKYKTVYPEPKISKYVFGHICSECNFIQLIRETVKEHAMVYHPGMPKIHKVNLGSLLCEHNSNLQIPAKVKELDVFDLSTKIEEMEEVKVKMESEVLEDDLHPFELVTLVGQPDLDTKQDSERGRTKMENKVSYDVRTDSESSLGSNLTIPVEIEVLSVFNVSSEIEELEELKVKIESEVLEEDPHPIEVTTFICQPDLDIKQDFEGDSDRLQAKLVTEPIEKSEKVQALKPPSTPLLTQVNNCNLNELVLPYNCQDDGFPRCSFKSLYFDEYLKHMKATHQIGGLCSFSSEDELLSKTIMEGWLVKEVGPFQCRYCKKATATHQEMEEHQVTFHVQRQCWFYYRKFVPNNTVTIPEQVNLEDPSFINHVIRLPDQVHLYNFNPTDNSFSVTSAKLIDRTSVQFPLQSPLRDSKIEIDQLKIPLDEPDIFTLPVDSKMGVVGKLDPLCLNNKPQKDRNVHSDAILDTKLTGEIQHKSTERKLQCKWEGCYQTYHSQMALIKHIEKKHVNSQRGEEFICSWLNCPRKSKPLEHRYALRIHMRFHSGEKPYKCHFQGCNKTFSHLGNLKAHRSRHMGERPYLCEFATCCKSFSKLSDKITHQRTHTGAKSHPCQVTGCSKEYKNPSSLRKHMKNHTIDEQIEVKQKSGENKQKEGDFVLKKSVDNFSGVVFERTHYDTLQCEWEDCYQIYNSQTALVTHIEENHVKSQKGTEFICFWINCPRKSKSFATKRNLLIHMRMHSGEKPCKCPFQGCNRSYSQLGSLREHQKRHTGERPHFCQFSTCYERFSNLMDRDTHERTHYDTKTYACQVFGCSNKYADPDSLRKHVKNHMFDEQLEVQQKLVDNNQKEGDFMLKKSSGSNGVKRQRTHYNTESCDQTYHSQTQEFTCVWNDCPRKSKPFTTKQSLLMHMRIHSGEKPYKCSFQGCNKAFPRLQYLRCHQRDHTGEGPYLCRFPNCFKSFSNNSLRSHHQKTHYDPTPYACHVTGCSKRYSNPSTLRKHVKNHTVDEQLENEQNRLRLRQLKSVKNKQKEGDLIIYHI